VCMWKQQIGCGLNPNSKLNADPVCGLAAKSNQVLK
jgi:hypothetical protein